jgi:aspartyl-tRNA(Asn)/glutamyl-tRNA(Gln) amidotransferase subunit B
MTSEFPDLPTKNGQVRVRIGVEIHAQIKTTSKMFCSCPTEFQASPNSQTCPVCLGYPGSLPVINSTAIDKALLFAASVGSSVATVAVLERKNYAYPDLPKGFQISQYRLPLARGGAIRFWFRSAPVSLGLRRIQIEEDTARMTHLEDRTLLDFNRSGVPLMEIVTEPDLSSAEEAVAYLIELRNILRTLDVCDGNIGEGSLRAEPNVSIIYEDTELPRVELKNLGSIRSVHLAVEHEADRQTRLASEGVRWSRETRGFDENSGTTYPLRLKESEEDYRYFPEPDLPPLVVDPDRLARLSRDIPELPCARRLRWQETCAILPAQADILIGDPALAAFFDGVLSPLGDRARDLARSAANWVVADLLGHIADRGGIATVRFAPAEIARLASLVAENAITRKSAKTILMKLVDHGGTTDHWLQSLNLARSTDESEINGWIRQALESEPDAVASFLSGKQSAFTALMGAVMRVSRGRADTSTARALLSARLQSLANPKEVIPND